MGEPAAGPATGGEPDPRQVGTIMDARLRQVGTAAASATATIAGDFGVPSLAPTITPAPLPAPNVPVDRSAPDGVPAEPSLEPAVADTLTASFGSQVRDRLDEASRQATQATAAHDARVKAAVTATSAEIDTERQAVATAQVQERMKTTTDLAAHRAQVQSEQAAATSAFQSTAAELGAGANVDISTRIASARSAAEAELAAAGPAPPAAQRRTVTVSGSWWSDAAGAIGRGVRAIGSGAASVVTAVRDRVSRHLDQAMSFVRDRLRRFGTAIASAASAVASRLAAAARNAATRMRDRVRTGLARINGLAQRLANATRGFASRLTSRLGKFLSGLRARLAGLWSKAAGFVRKVIKLAGAARTFLRLMADRALSTIIDVIRDPAAAVERMKAKAAGMVAQVPAKLEGVLAEHVAPRLGPSSAGAPIPAARAPVQRQALEPPAEAAEDPSHWGGVKRHLGARVDYLKENWWEVLKDAALEVLVPGVAQYRHLPTMWKEIVAAWDAFRAGRHSEGWDHVLGTCRELVAMVSAVVAQASIVVFIVVSVFGTPVAGAGALTTIGLTVLGVDLALQAATIAKSSSNLAGRAPQPPSDANETDYGRVADSSIAVAFMLALILLGAIASSAAKALLSRFPALAAALEGAKARLRKSLGIKPEQPPVPKPQELKDLKTKLSKDTGTASGWAPEAKGFKVRDELTTLEQRAFDRWVQERRSIWGAETPAPTAAELDARLRKALDNKSADVVRKMLKDKIEWAAEQQKLINKINEVQGHNPLDPPMKNGPTKQGTSDVWVRYDDSPPMSREIGEAQRLSQRTGERVDLYGDSYPGIDGTIGSNPRRPLQLKGGIDDAGPVGAKKAAESAVDALADARKTGYSQVEVSIEAPNVTRAEMAAELRLQTEPYFDGGTVTRLIIWCKDGPLAPSPVRVVVPPPHPHIPDDKKEAVPAH
jgi:hypothetical protein